MARGSSLALVLAMTSGGPRDPVSKSLIKRGGGPPLNFEHEHLICLKVRPRARPKLPHGEVFFPWGGRALRL